MVMRAGSRLRQLALVSAALPLPALAIFVLSVYHPEPDWDTAVFVTHISFAAGFAAVISSALVLIRHGFSVVMLGTLLLGAVTILVAGFVEILAHSCVICI